MGVGDFLSNGARSLGRGLHRVINLPNWMHRRYVHAMEAVNQRRDIFDTADEASLSDEEFWWKIRRDAHWSAAIENRMKGVAGLEDAVVPGPREPEEQDVLLARWQQAGIDTMPDRLRTRLQQTEGIFIGDSWHALEGEYRLMTMPGDTKERRWFVFTGATHVGRWRFKIVNPGEGAPRHWEMRSFARRKWERLRRPQHFMRFSYQISEDTHGYGRGINTFLRVWLKGKAIAMNEGLAGVRNWAQGILKVGVDSFREGSVGKTNEQQVEDWRAVALELLADGILLHDKDEIAELMFPSGQGHEMAIDWTRYFDEGAFRLIQASTLTTGKGDDESGAYALAGVQDDNQDAFFQTDRMLLGNAWTQGPLALFMELNAENIEAAFGDLDLPPGVSGKYQIGEREVRSPATEMEGVIGPALDRGISLPRSWVHDRLEIPEPQDGEPVITSRGDMGGFDTPGLPSPDGADDGTGLDQTDEPDPDVDPDQPTQPEPEADDDADRTPDREGSVVQPTEAQVLNGAQVQAAKEIVTAVAAKELPADSAAAMLVAFFNLDAETASAMVSPAAEFEQAKPDPPAGPPVPPTPLAPDEPTPDDVGDDDPEDE